MSYVNSAIFCVKLLAESCLFFVPLSISFGAPAPHVPFGFWNFTMNVTMRKLVKTPWSYLQWFWHDIGLWRTDRRMYFTIATIALCTASWSAVKMLTECSSIKAEILSIAQPSFTYRPMHTKCERSYHCHYLLCRRMQALSVAIVKTYT